MLLLTYLVVAGVDMEKNEVRPTPLLCSTRLGLSIIGFFMFFHLYAQRVGMSVAIVCMVNQTAVSMMTASGMNDNSSSSVNANVLGTVARASVTRGDIPCKLP